MMWRTHVVIGISTLWLLNPLTAQTLGYDFGVLAACAALGSLLPDLDASESKIKNLKLAGTKIQPFFLPSLIASQTDQHRGILHSAVGLGILAVMSSTFMPWVGWPPILSLLQGYLSHLLADSMTKSGIRWLYPRPNRFHLLPPILRVTTGSPEEEIYMVVFALVSLGLLIAQISP